MTEEQYEPLLLGFGLAGYRSFHDELRTLGPLARVTLLAGQNNAGKSNVLRFVRHFLAESPEAPAAIDRPRLPDGLVRESPLRMALATRVTEADMPKIANSSMANSVERFALVHLLDAPSVRGDAPSSLWNDNGTMRCSDDSLVWLVYAQEAASFARGDGVTGRWQLDEQWLADVAADLNASGQLQNMLPLARAMRSTTYGEAEKNLPQIFERFSPLGHLPPVKTIDAFRQIKAGDPSDDFTPAGKDLVTALAGLQHPDEHNQADKKRFQAINRFLQTVLSDDTARLEVTGQPEKLLVERQGIVLPLSSLGTGVHQVVIMAAVATLYQRTLICVEEPEVHLHPLLQRKLLRYLARETDNQYLVATHSAHMLDHTAAAIYHLQPDPAGTAVQLADTSQGIADICYDLGYRPSDLLQANAVIWVEGPSDRLYLRRWLQDVDDELEEHVHYSIMFYGGATLSHLSTGLDEQIVDDLIRLRRLNRHLAVVFDSDKADADDGITETKQRILDGFGDGGPGFAWMTNCRTIENYVPPALLNAKVVEAHPSANPNWKGGQYTAPLPKKPEPRKVKIAHKVCDAWTAGDYRWGLLEDLTRLAAFVRTANGLEPKQ